MSSQKVPTAAEIQDIFNQIAPVYDELNNRLSFGLHRIWKLMTVKWSRAKLGDTALDLCCGSGDLTQLLAKQVGNTGKVIGLDFSQAQLAIAQKRTQNQFLPITWQAGDALNLPFSNNYFDCATMGYGLRNVTNIPLCLGELHRVLKIGSTAAILDFNRPRQPFMSSFMQWYLDNVVVNTAKQLDLTAEYAYIAPSLERFPTGEAQVNLAREAGFTQAIHYPIAFDTMGVLVVTK